MLGYHYSRSDNFEKACHYLKLSGKKAEGKFCSWEAIGFYKETIDMLNRQPEDEKKKREKLEVIHLTTFPMLHLGYPEDLLPILQEGERLSKELDDKRSLVMIYGRMGSYFAYIGKPLRGMKYAESAFEEARKIQDVDLMAPAAFELCAPTMGAGEFLKTVDIAVSVLNLIEQTNRQSDFFGQSMNVYSALCGRCGGSMSYLGHFHEAEAVLEKGLLNATAIGDLRSLAVVELYCGHMFWAKGVWERAKEHYEICIKHSQEMKSSTPSGWKSSTRCWPITIPGATALKRLAGIRDYPEKRQKETIPTGRPVIFTKAPWTCSTSCLKPRRTKRKRWRSSI